ncbi:MAG TPA: hypothetical protein VFX20_16085 [Steroidobacteraceae bacterium]|nr:hypothetical protein [Steroidobacteraceae bacterium]
MRLPVSAAGVLILAGSLGTAAVAIAQDDGCGEVLQRAARNYTEDDYANATASQVYDEVCRGSHSKNASAGGLSFGAIIDSLPARFGATGNSSSEKQENFCHTYSALLSNNTTSVQTSDTVVADSVSAWLECKRLASAGISFSPTILRTQFSISVKRTNAEPAEITGFIYDHKLANCTIPEKGLLGNKAIPVDADTYFPLDSDKQVTVACKRIGQPESDGTTSYPQIDFTVRTDRGALALPVFPDAQAPYRWSTSVQEEIVQLQKSERDLAAQARKMALGKAACEWEPFVKKEHSDTEYPISCKEGKYVRSIKFEHPSGQNLTYQESVSVQCCPLGG